MPTGYTADLYEGKAVSFNEFVLAATRGMGAAIMQRDDGPGPIADEYQPSDYHRLAHVKAEATLAELQRLSLYEWAQREKGERNNHINLDRAADEKSASIRARYESMLAQVRTWRPPTTEHVQFKEFMVEQLERSIEYDCAVFPNPERPIRSAFEFRDAALTRAESDVAYHREEWVKEQERTASRNKWVRDLKGSLAPANH